jgi:hypothetical protein
MKFLKQSTASQNVLLGPFVDDTDGTTAETALTIANTDIRVSKAGANIAAKNSGGGTHDELGYYQITLDATDTNTVGLLQIVCKMAGALVVEDSYYVLEEAVYDDLFGASAAGYAGVSELATVDANVDAILVDTSTTLDTHLTDIKGATFSGATDSLEAIRDRGDSAWTGAPPTVHTGTAQAGAAGSITLDAGASATDDLYKHLRVSITSGTGSGQSRAINGYNGTTKVATVINNWATNPDATSGFEIVSDAITEISAAPTAAAVADAVWDESTAGHTTAGTFGEQMKNDVDAILADTGEMQADLANGGRLDLIFDAILADTNELQTDDVPTTLATLATAANLATVDTVVDGIQTDLDNATDGLGAIKATIDLAATAAALATVDTVVDAIKVITDQMVFTKANELDVNTQSINGAAVVGDGNATPWDGA